VENYKPKKIITAKGATERRKKPDMKVFQVISRDSASREKKDKIRRHNGDASQKTNSYRKICSWLTVQEKGGGIRSKSGSSGKE